MAAVSLLFFIQTRLGGLYIIHQRNAAKKKVKTCWCCATDDRSNQQQRILTALSRSFFLDNFNVQCRHRHKDALRAPLQKKLLPLGSRSSALRRRAFFFLFNSLRTASSAWRVDMLQRCQDFNSDCRLIKKKATGKRRSENGRPLN